MLKLFEKPEVNSSGDLKGKPLILHFHLGLLVSPFCFPGLDLYGDSMTSVLQMVLESVFFLFCNLGVGELGISTRLAGNTQPSGYVLLYLFCLEPAR